MALFPCPECKKHVSESAHACPSCGVPITLAMIETHRQGIPQAKSNPFAAILIVGAIVGGVAFCAGVRSIGTNASETFSGVAEKMRASQSPRAASAAEKLVVIEYGRPDDDKALLMGFQLEELSRRYRIDEELVAAKLLTAQELLAKKGTHMLVADIAANVQASDPTGGAVSFDELLAMYVTLRQWSMD
jgi:hypothetical protein